MAHVLLVVRFHHSLSESDYSALAQQAAPAIADVPGLIWKLFLIEGPGRAGGAYLFQTRHDADAYVSGEILTHVRRHPAVTAFSAEVFDILSEPSRLTHGSVAGFA